jgi:hypothetical protein
VLLMHGDMQSDGGEDGELCGGLGFVMPVSCARTRAWSAVLRTNATTVSVILGAGIDDEERDDESGDRAWRGLDGGSHVHGRSVGVMEIVRVRRRGWTEAHHGGSETGEAL